ncbi:MAG: Hsp20/alpha crystallin family protein [Deltaproteobacteria bacterium]|nr:Hsp20/alpha crystallin family protein [Deltaproteobacteria bacterium]
MARIDFGLWDPRSEMERFFSGFRRATSESSPPMNIFTSEEGVVITSEMSGIDPEKIELSVVNDKLTIEGIKPVIELKEGESWHRRERGYGKFHRKVRLPFSVEGDKVEATYENGILKVSLPRAEADKPRKISVKMAE